MNHHFLQLVQQQPALSLNLARILSERLDESRNDIEALTFLTTEQRVARALLGLARNYGRTIISNQRLTKIVIPLSHERLAQLIGGNRPQISTIMSKFKKLGWLQYRSRRLLIDVEAVGSVVDGLEAAG